MCLKPIRNGVTKTKIFENNIIFIISIEKKESAQWHKSFEK